MKKTKLMFACFSIAGLTALNFTQSRASFLRNTLASSSDEDLLECTDASSSTATSSSTEAIDTTPLAYSNQIKCKEGPKGTYFRICQKNGPADSRNEGGSTTCTCGQNCG